MGPVSGSVVGLPRCGTIPRRRSQTPGGKKVAGRGAAAGRWQQTWYNGRRDFERSEHSEEGVMQRVVIDADLRARLRNLNEPLEFQDESGQVLGHYMPTFKPTNADELMKSCPVSEEELERRGQAIEGRTLSEIWKAWDARHKLRRDVAAGGGGRI